MHTATITTGDGCRIAYRFDGPEQAPVLMLSNSLGTSIDMWAPQIQPFAARYRVLRYDSRGHGASDVPTGAYSMDRLGRDVIELLDALRIARVSFCGLSKGGMVGQWLGWRAPEWLDRLILCNTSGYMGPPASWDGRIALVLDQGMAALADTVLERWFTPEFRAAANAKIQPVRDMLLATAPAGYAGCCAAIRDMDMRRVNTLITVPTLVIGGTQDPATPPDHAAAISQSIAGARLALLDAAHLSNVEKTEAFNSEILNFLAS